MCVYLKSIISTGFIQNGGKALQNRKSYTKLLEFSSEQAQFFFAEEVHCSKSEVNKYNLVY